ncbi:MAG: TIGR00297 family protein [Coleofasciculaceae cyanobacterium SM2_1_6]|nr:TIGR00297 family protein [Coleofasciculaceae cyanobacterium SM2_1_6]
MPTNIFSLNPWLIAVALNTILLIPATLAPKKLLTPAGTAHAWVLGVLIWGCLGWQGYAVIMFYFLVGSAITRVGMAEKQAAGIAEKRDGARGPENVWGSALTGTFCALGVLGAGYWGQAELIPGLILGYVASLSTKLSDTCASEIGKAYGKSTFLITTLKPVPRGTEGAVSLEGTIAGIIGSIALAAVALGLGMINFWGFLCTIIAAFVATNIESVIGATVQTKFPWLTNEIVNFINTLIGAIVAMILFILIFLKL